MVDPSQLPSLASIRAFEAAARLGGFARAAEELRTTPASVSYHVRQLERQIGMPLFTRRAQCVELTAGGASIAGEVTDFFASLRAAFMSAVDAYEARLSLTALPTFGTSWLTPKLGRFHALHADIAIELDLSETAHDLGAGRFDAAIRNGHGRWPGLRAFKLMPSIFAPLCAPALKEAAKNLPDPRRLEAPLLGRPDWWTLWYRALGARDIELSGRFCTTLQAEYLDATAALAGQGITIGSPLLFEDEIKAGRLVPAHELVASDGRAFWFAFPVARAGSRKIKHFSDWARDEAEQTRERGAGFIAGARTPEA